MTTSTNDGTYQLFVGVDIAETFAKISWLVPGATPTRAITMEQSPGVFRALEQRLLSTGYSASHMLVADGSDWFLLDQPSDDTDAIWLCRECDQPVTSSPFCPRLCSSEPAPDAIDAQTLAQLACLLEPTPWTPPPQVYAELQQRLAQRDSLLELRQPGAQSTACPQPDAHDHSCCAHSHGAVDRCPHPSLSLPSMQSSQLLWN